MQTTPFDVITTMFSSLAQGVVIVGLIGFCIVMFNVIYKAHQILKEESKQYQQRNRRYHD